MKTTPFGPELDRQKGHWFWQSPHLTRRILFRHLASALGGYFLMPQRPGERIAHAAATPKKTARNVIFVRMAGGPSHVDTFDFKEGSWLTQGFNPTRYNGVLWPQGLLPQIAESMDQIALLRSVRSWAAVHEIASNWMQLGRNPVAPSSRFAPHIGSVVALELTDRSKPLPAFFTLNANSGLGPGYLPPVNAPFFITPGGNGLSTASHPDGGQAGFERRYALLQEMDAETRASEMLGVKGAEVEQFNLAARQLIHNPDINRIFTFDAAERARYGNTGFGNACIAARNLLRNDVGTRFVQINVGGWDTHGSIYTTSLNPNNANSLGRQFDRALGTLLSDLKSEGMLGSTMVVAMGEFGRTIGGLNASAGRDHFLQQAVLIAGGGIRGGQALGETDALGSQTTEAGWDRDRPMRAEDIEATIYSALGIDWTTVRYDDPTGRGFYYVPESDKDSYGPIHKLWD
jgi:hypothetical protein